MEANLLVCELIGVNFFLSLSQILSKFLFLHRSLSAEHIQDPTTGRHIILQDATTSTLYRYAASARLKGLHIPLNKLEDYSNSKAFGMVLSRRELISAQ
jgi:hypothetical protein